MLSRQQVQGRGATALVMKKVISPEREKADTAIKDIERDRAADPEVRTANPLNEQHRGLEQEVEYRGARARN